MTQNNNRCRVISQMGTITRVSGSHADIRIVQTGACASCAIKGVCHPGDAVEKVVHAELSAHAAVGDRVRIDMDVRHGQLGVLVSYVIPLLLVVGTLFGVRPHVARESYAGLVAIATLVPYYGLVFLARDIFARIVHFRATPLQKEGLT